MSMRIVSVKAPVCSTCGGATIAPDPERPGRWMDCPECVDDLDPTDGGAALPAAPVGELDLWAVSADESWAIAYPARFDPIEDAKFMARVWADHCLETFPRLAGGTVRVCDVVGNEWDRIPLPDRVAA